VKLTFESNFFLFEFSLEFFCFHGADVTSEYECEQLVFLSTVYNRVVDDDCLNKPARNVPKTVRFL
jgi:hypothetical protein